MSGKGGVGVQMSRRGCPYGSAALLSLGLHMGETCILTFASGRDTPIIYGGIRGE